MRKELIGQELNCIETIVIYLNKNALSHMKYQQYTQSLNLLKKAENIIFYQYNQHPRNQKIKELLGLTFNNLACYYRSTQKFKVALKYLENIIQLKAFSQNDQISLASTYMNLCAIYSSLQNHVQASININQSIKILQGIQFQKQDSSQQAQAYKRLKMLCYYNKGIQEQYLKVYQTSIESYQKAKEIALEDIDNNQQLIQECEKVIHRNSQILINIKQKMIDLVLRRHNNSSFKEKSISKIFRINKTQNNGSSALKKNHRSMILKRQKPQIKLFKGQKSSSRLQQKIQSPIKIQRKFKIAHFKNFQEYISQKKRTSSLNTLHYKKKLL